MYEPKTHREATAKPAKSRRKPTRSEPAVAHDQRAAAASADEQTPEQAYAVEINQSIEAAIVNTNAKQLAELAEYAGATSKTMRIEMLTVLLDAEPPPMAAIARVWQTFGPELTHVLRSPDGEDLWRESQTIGAVTVDDPLHQNAKDIPGAIYSTPSAPRVRLRKPKRTIRDEAASVASTAFLGVDISTIDRDKAWTSLSETWRLAAIKKIERAVEDLDPYEVYIYASQASAVPLYLRLAMIDILDDHLDTNPEFQAAIDTIWLTFSPSELATTLNNPLFRPLFNSPEVPLDAVDAAQGPPKDLGEAISAIGHELARTNIAGIIQRQDIAAIYALHRNDGFAGLALLNDAQRFGLLRLVIDGEVPSQYDIYVKNWSLRTLRDEVIHDLWTSFGPRLPDVMQTRAALDLWEKSGDVVDDLPVAKSFCDDFAAAVYAEVRAALTMNTDFADCALDQLAQDRHNNYQYTAELQRVACGLRPQLKARDASQKIVDAWKVPSLFSLSQAGEHVIMRGTDRRAAEAQLADHNSALASQYDTYPILYLLQQNHKLDQFAAAGIYNAFSMARGAVKQLKSNITRTWGMIASTLTYDQFDVVHDRLFERDEWKGRLRRGVVDRHLAAIDSAEFWRGLGLSLMQAVFTLAPLAGPFGIAARLLVAGISVHEAVMSWDKVAALELASNTGMKPTTEIVSEEAAAAARLNAWINTVAAGPDVLDVGRAVLVVNAASKATRAGRALKATHDVAQKGKISPTLATALESVADGRVLREEAERLVKEGIDSGDVEGTVLLAGGYEHLTEVLAKDSPLGEALKQWRQGVFEELEAEISLKYGVDVIFRTGSDKWTSDLDISLLGDGAYEAKAYSHKWLSARLGIKPDKLGRMLYSTGFTDPRRMHFYDMDVFKLSDDVKDAMARRIAHENEGLFWAARHRAAVAAGDPAEAAALITRYGPEIARAGQLVELGANDLRALNELVEAKVKAALLDAKNGLHVSQDRILDISRMQAHINTMNSEAFLSAGGTKKIVTIPEGAAKDGLPKIPPFADIAAQGMRRSEEFSAAHDMIRMVDRDRRKWFELMASGLADKDAQAASAMRHLLKAANRYLDDCDALLTPVLREDLKGMGFTLPERVDLTVVGYLIQDMPIPRQAVTMLNGILDRLRDSEKAVLDAMRKEAGLPEDIYHVTNYQRLNLLQARLRHHRELIARICRSTVKHSLQAALGDSPAPPAPRDSPADSAPGGGEESDPGEGAHS
jgi:hypothetical protein